MDLKGSFLKEETQKSNEYVKRCSDSLVIQGNANHDKNDITLAT